MARSCLVVGAIILTAFTGFAALLLLPQSMPSTGLEPSVIVATPQVEVAPLPLTETYDLSPTAFKFNYPVGWMVQLPQQGLLILAPEETLRGIPGASMVVQRSVRLAGENDLEAALNSYLENGPLRNQREWNILAERITTTLGDRTALRVELEGRQIDDAPLTRVSVIIAEADSGAIYIITFTAPSEQWVSISSTFEAILGSMTIIE